MMGTPQEDRPKERPCAAPTECRSTPIDCSSTDARGCHSVVSAWNQPIENFPLVVAQVSRSMTHMSVDATVGACGYFRPGGHWIGSATLAFLITCLVPQRDRLPVIGVKSHRPAKVLRSYVTWVTSLGTRYPLACDLPEHPGIDSQNRQTESYGW